ncbi:acVLRF1 family peptidyl-tRNA hydrolase [Microlunatus ginsengisoli]|uniref:AcVLRF1 family peptidyl-tRNA hydrolase n=1 Tax=Microlunatus ginsengisoli TaxID=363863 RepID=A0ABP6ZJ34_9ACTN
MRTVAVDASRLQRWLSGFTERHGPTTASIATDQVGVSAEDGAEARISVPFPPLIGETVADLIAHVARDRTVGALLVRRGGVAVGVFEGRQLVTSKIETRYVQGRTKAGGWSQQRYARRRQNQAQELIQIAADLAASLLLPRIGDLDALATGGDRAAVDSTLADARLAALRAHATQRCYPVPDPRLAVLRDFPNQFLAVEITLNELA